MALVTLARKGIGIAPRFLLSLLAIQVALNSVYDIRVLFLIDRGPSDAVTMARLFVLPSWVWATTWMLMSIAMLGATLWMTRGRSGLLKSNADRDDGQGTRDKGTWGSYRPDPSARRARPTATSRPLRAGLRRLLPSWAG
jgi:hypothetical protein